MTTATVTPVGYLTVAQAATYTGLSRATLRQYARDGKIPSHGTPCAPVSYERDGYPIRYERVGRVLFKVTELEAWLESRRRGPAPRPREDDCGLPMPAVRRFG